MKNNIKYKFSFSTIVAFLASCLLLLVSPSYAQKDNKNSSGDITKSKKIEAVEGRKFYMHTVEKGQTLYAIAKAYDIKVNDIVIENPEVIDGIKPKQVIKIPVEKNRTKPPVITKADSVKYHFHQVQQSETMYSISKQFAIAIEKINELNPEVKDGLKAGQLIKLPADRAKLESRNKEIKTIVEPAIIPKVKPSINAPGTNAPIEASTKVTVFKSDTITRSNNFNIALFLPFHLNESQLIDVERIAKGDEKFPYKSEIALQFYQGARLALDSLKKLGLSAKVHVYDIDEKDSVQMQQLLAKPELMVMDIMVGPLYSSNFGVIANFAKENQIYIVSPLSQQNKILFNNPFVSKVVGSTTTQLEQMADHIAKTYKGQNVIVINSGNPKEINYVSAFKKRINENYFRAGLTDTVTEAKIYGYGPYISSTKTNIVVVPSNDRAKVTDLITKLQTLSEKNPIILFGMQGWTDFDNLDLEYLNKLQLHLPSQSYIDHASVPVKAFVKQYADQYKTDPGEYVFQGFDVMMYYMNVLRNHGFNFQNKLPTIKQSGLQTSFDYYQVSPESGFENRYVYLLKYQDYKLVKVN